MSNSVLTHSSALLALQNLNRTNERLTDVQARLGSGLQVAGAKDSAPAWSIAQTQRADVGALQAVATSLNRAASVTDLTLAAGEAVADILVELKKGATAAADPSLSVEGRKAYDGDFQTLLGSIAAYVENANFDGENILNGASSEPLKVLANADASDPITVDRLNFTLVGLGLASAAGGDRANVLDASAADAALLAVNTALERVGQGLAQLGAQAKQIENHARFVSQLSDVLETGVGRLVDADMAKESARLQALQVQQQLGTQALSLANQAPEIILSLFRN